MHFNRDETIKDTKVNVNSGRILPTDFMNVPNGENSFFQRQLGDLSAVLQRCNLNLHPNTTKTC